MAGKDTKKRDSDIRRERMAEAVRKAICNFEIRQSDSLDELRRTWTR